MWIIAELFLENEWVFFFFFKWQSHGFFADCPLAFLGSQTWRYFLRHPYSSTAHKGSSQRWMPTVIGRDGRHTQGGVLGTRGMLQPRHVHFYYTLQSRLPHIFYRLCLQAEACQSTERLLHKRSYQFSLIYNQGFSFSVNSKTPLLLQTPRTHRIICLSLDYQ